MSFDPQLPVWHVPDPDVSKLQPVRPQIRPDQLTGAVKTTDWPGLRTKPPPLKYSPGKTAGQMVSLQPLMKVKTLLDWDGFGPGEKKLKVRQILDV